MVVQCLYNIFLKCNDENSVLTSVVVSLQTAGSRRNGVTMCQSSAGVSIGSWRLAKGPSGFGTSTFCIWSSCGRWLKPCPSSRGRPSSCTPAERQRTGSTNSCCLRSCTWPSGSDRTQNFCCFQFVMTGDCSASVSQIVPAALWRDVFVCGERDRSC